MHDSDLASLKTVAAAPQSFQARSLGSFIPRLSQEWASSNRTGKAEQLSRVAAPMGSGRRQYSVTGSDSKRAPKPLTPHSSLMSGIAASKSSTSGTQKAEMELLEQGVVSEADPKQFTVVRQSKDADLRKKDERKPLVWQTAADSSLKAESQAIQAAEGSRSSRQRKWYVSGRHIRRSCDNTDITRKSLDRPLNASSHHSESETTPTAESTTTKKPPLARDYSSSETPAAISRPSEGEPQSREGDLEAAHDIPDSPCSEGSVSTPTTPDPKDTNRASQEQAGETLPQSKAMEHALTQRVRELETELSALGKCLKHANSQKLAMETYVENSRQALQISSDTHRLAAREEVMEELQALKTEVDCKHQGFLAYKLFCRYQRRRLLAAKVTLEEQIKGSEKSAAASETLACEAAQLRAEVDTLKQARAVVMRKMSKLRQDLTAETARGMRLEGAQEQAASLRVRLADVEKAHEELKSQYHCEIDREVQAQASTQEKTLKAESSNQAGELAESQGLVAQNDILSSEVQRLCNDLATTKEDLAKATAENESLKHELSTQAKGVKLAESREGAVQHDGLFAEVQRLKTEADKAKEEVAKAAEKEEKLHEQLSKQEKELADSQDFIAQHGALFADVQKLSSEAEQAREDLAAAAEAEEALKQQLVRQAHELAESQNALLAIRQQPRRSPGDSPKTQFDSWENNTAGEHPKGAGSATKVQRAPEAVVHAQTQSHKKAMRRSFGGLKWRRVPPPISTDLPSQGCLSLNIGNPIFSGQQDDMDQAEPHRIPKPFVPSKLTYGSKEKAQMRHEERLASSEIISSFFSRR